jgi:integrase
VIVPFADTAAPAEPTASTARVTWSEPWLASWFDTGRGSSRYNPGMNPHLSPLPALDLLPGSSNPAPHLPAQPPTPDVRPVGGTDGGVPAGLTVADATRIAEAMSACHADSTHTIYAGAWNRWERWCVARDIDPMPAHPAAICAYLAERAATGPSIGALDTDCSAIAYTHRRHRLPDPLCDEAVRAVRRGLRRIVGTAPRRQARPLGTPEIRQIVAAIDRTPPKGARDTAVILLGFPSALRRSELAALTLDDIDAQPGGVVIAVRSSKTEPRVSRSVRRRRPRAARGHRSSRRPPLLAGGSRGHTRTPVHQHAPRSPDARPVPRRRHRDHLRRFDQPQRTPSTDLPAVRDVGPFFGLSIRLSVWE